MEHYSAFKKKETLSYASVWINLEDVMLKEVSQSLKNRYCMIPLCEASKAVKLIETESRMVVDRGGGRGKCSGDV